MKEKAGTTRFSAFAMMVTLLVIGAVQLVEAQNLRRQHTSSQPTQLSFTQDAGVAYLEALAFCLQQIGSPITLSEPEREMILKEITRQFPTLTRAEQVKLASAPVV